jgi:hypothetical protein
LEEYALTCQEHDSDARAFRRRDIVRRLLARSVWCNATVKQQACCSRYVVRLNQDSLLRTTEDNFGLFKGE